MALFTGNSRPAQTQDGTGTLFKIFKKKKRRPEPIKSPIDLIRDAMPDLDETVVQRIADVQPYTMTSTERISALIDAVDYVCDKRIPGDIVECGVWRGGSMMAVASTLKFRNSIDRDLWLFDTFEGMSAPESRDIDHSGHAAKELLNSQSREDPSSIWCQCNLEEVQKNLLKVGYPKSQLRFVKGPVENTIPGSMPDKISLLRLDTDWYQSTKHELVHLFPKLSDGGVLIIDDYGHWQGCREAVDEYFQEHDIPILLNRIDYTGRIGIKVPSVNSSQQSTISRKVA